MDLLLLEEKLQPEEVKETANGHPELGLPGQRAATCHL